MANEGKYMRQAPGQVCERCGVDNSFRLKGTKWCYDCSRELANERKRKDKAYVALLKRRDSTTSGPYDCCIEPMRREHTFCSTCGQRLRGGPVNELDG